MSRSDVAPLLVLLFVLVLLWLALPRIERRLVFFPSRQWEIEPFQMGIDARELRFPSEDGVQLSGLWMESPDPVAVVVYAHGNAGNLSHRIPTAEVWRRELGLSILLFDYRGYGRSAGTPDEEGLLKDLRAAFDEAWRLGGESPLLLGRSLGTVPAIGLAAEQDVRALILDSPLASAAQMARTLLPLPGIGSVISMRLDNVTRIRQVRCPTLIIHGETDRVVPVSQGREVFEAAPEARFYLLEGRGHNDPRTSPDVLDEMRRFISALPGRERE